jgi:RND family efflux transporter MFP subunit
LTLALALAGCSPAPPGGLNLPPPAVTVSLPLERTVTDSNDFTGRTAAVGMIQVRARVTGYLDTARFKDGDPVRENDVLFEIDPRVYRAAHDQAAASVAQMEARVARMQADYDRALSLVDRSAVSREEFEKYKGDLKEAQAGLSSARAALASAQLNVDFTKVRSPLSGRVSRRNVDPGNLVKADDTVLTSIVTQDPVYAYFDVDDLTFMQVGRQVLGGQGGPGGKRPSVLLGLAGEQGFPHRGTIDFVDNQVDPGTGTVRMRGVFDNKGGALTPGLFARVRVPLGGSRQALLVTDRAVDTDQGQKVLYVVGPDNVVDKRPVQLGGLHDGLREIVSGVKAGERVVVDGIQRVRGGVTVEPRLVEMPVYHDPRLAPGAPEVPKPAGKSDKS